MFDYFINFYINLERGVTFLLTGLLFSLMIVVLFAPKKDVWYKYFYYLIDFAIVFIVITFFECLFQYLFNNAYDIFIVKPSFALLYGLIRNYKGIKKERKIIIVIVIYAAIYYGLMLSSLVISEAVGSYILDKYEKDTPLTLIVQALVLTLPSLYMRSKKIKIYANTPIYCSLITLFITILHIILYYITAINLIEYKTILAILNSFFILIELASFSIYYLVSKEHEEKLKYQALTIKDEMNEDLISMGKAEIEKLKQIRHDMKNHISYMSILLENKDYDTLKNYYKQYSSEIYDAVTFSQCGNSTIDYILNIEYQKGNNSNIVFDSKIAVSPVLVINDKDICAVLMNLIDNAIEAVNELEDNKKISIRIRQNQNNLIIRVSNQISENRKLILQTQKFESTKEDKVSHGYGIRIIKNITKKYNGAFNYQIKENEFVADVMLSTYVKEKES